MRCVDLSVDPFDVELLSWADAVACSVPMHTAMRLARQTCRAIRRVAPRWHCASTACTPVSTGPKGARLSLTSPSWASTSLAWWRGPTGSSRCRTPRCRTPRRLARRSPARPHAPLPRTVVELGRGRFGLPARHLLPGLDRYARLALGAERRLAGYTEASHGCAHRCRHCPVPVVYDGRTRVVAEEAVLADVAQLRSLGARHITFGDPDFLNGPHHSTRVVDAVHGAFPELTFDVTVKVEHILRHRDLWPKMAAAGCLFAVSAFESASEHILVQLDKGHRADEAAQAVAILRSAGVEPRPSLLPFTPWTTPADIVALLDLVARCDLVGNVDPVQYAIRLLVPPGSLLLTSGRLDGYLDAYDDEHLGWSWRARDPRLDALHTELSTVATRAAAEEWSAQDSYDAVRAMARHTLGDAVPAEAPCRDPRLRSPVPADERPRLTEAWFCCAEPSGAQMAAVGVPSGTDMAVAVGGK